MAVDKAMRVLAVDDYQTMLRIISNLLQQLGFRNIDTASSGDEAEERSSEHQLLFHLVVV